MNPSFLRRRLLAATALFALAFTGCDATGNDADDARGGSFEARISGSIVKHAHGTAVHPARDKDGARVFAIGLTTADTDAEKTIQLVGAGSPAERAYAITEAGTEGGALLAVSTSDDGDLFADRAGTFTIIGRSEHRIEGRFSLDAAGLLDTARAVLLEGTLTAVRGAIDLD